MFRNRRSSQKPNEELYAAFKQNFPGVGPTESTSADVEPVLRSTSLSDALTDAQVPHRQFGDLDDVKDNDITPKPLHDTWRFTPSIMDPNSFAFASFANQPPGYYTPTPGGVNTLYHSQAGDLHTPGMGMTIGTPLSLPHTAHGLHAQDGSMADLHHFQPHFLHGHPFQNINPFAAQHSMAPQQTFHPSSFLQHQDSGFEAVDGSPNKSPQKAEIIQAVSAAGLVPGVAETAIPTVPPTMGEKFRYHVTLSAPTAMVKHADEIPVSYLNKGQAYTLSVIDTAALGNVPATPVRYRTFVRVSFEDEQQRSKPAACWQLWKEGRGTNEAHQRGGKLLAVEYVDPHQGGDDETRKPQIEVEYTSFDGFCVTWAPNPITGGADCAISVRFNFLSTDFSHSKGVKGIPVRLCSKTEMIQPTPAESPIAGEPEVCYCKVKLFRDHGAERKLSNDIAHVKKTIEKLKQQIAQAESGMGSFGKRKRSGSTVKMALSKPGKVLKHKRTWSIDSENDGSGRPSAEEDLHMKLATMQDMFSSTRPVSVLFLKGDPEDDPDKFPVQLAGDSAEMSGLTRTQTWESNKSPESTSATSNGVSPSPSSNSPPSVQNVERRQSSIAATAAAQPLPPSRKSSMEWQQPQSPVKIQKHSSSGAFINAVGIDTAYVPPPERSIKPVACFYVAVQDPNTAQANSLYRAVYLMQRSLPDLVNGIANKFSVDPTRISSVIRVNTKGIKIIIDDDVLNEIPEGQDMYVEFHDAQDALVKIEQSLNPSLQESLLGNDTGFISGTSTGLQMRLIF